MEYTPDESYCLFGAEALLKRLRVLVQNIPRVRKAEEDIEAIHDMRVASRRMRSVIRLFQECFPDKNTKKWRKQIRAVTKALGSTRDLEVQMDFLQGFLDKLPERRYQAGIKRLLLRISQRREKLQPSVVKAMDQLESSGLFQDISESARQARALAKLNKIDDHSIGLYKGAYLAISLRLEEMLSYEPYVYQPERVSELHAMRISAKRLRYTMEVFDSLYEDNLKNPLKSAREIQTILGDVNDCVVWINSLPKFLDEERERTIEYFGYASPVSRLKSGILYLMQNRQEYQAERYTNFVEFWQKILEQDVWGNLLQTILQPCSESNL